MLLSGILHDMGKAQIQFEKGYFYTRRQIHESLGGDEQSYLPMKSGKVVCACLRKDLNPDAPRIICCGSLGKVMQAGEMLDSQKEPIPVFIRSQANEWEYVGMYSVDRVSTNPEELQQRSVEGELPLSRIIYMKPHGEVFKEHIA